MADQSWLSLKHHTPQVTSSPDGTGRVHSLKLKGLESYLFQIPFFMRDISGISGNKNNTKMCKPFKVLLFIIFKFCLLWHFLWNYNLHVLNFSIFPHMFEVYSNALKDEKADEQKPKKLMNEAQYCVSEPKIFSKNLGLTV